MGHMYFSLCRSKELTDPLVDWKAIPQFQFHEFRAIASRVSSAYVLRLLAVVVGQITTHFSWFCGATYYCNCKASHLSTKLICTHAFSCLLGAFSPLEPRKASLPVNGSLVSRIKIPNLVGFMKCLY